MIAFNPTIGNEFSNSLFEPILKPSENIKIMIAQNVTPLRLRRFLLRKKYPRSTPTINGNIRSIGLSTT
jgi:hypothetical protein